MISFLMRNSYTFLATSGMTESSLMETDFLVGTLGWGVMLLFVGICPAPAGGLLLTPTEILIIFATKNYLDIVKSI